MSKDKRVTFRCTENEFNALKRLSAEYGLSISAFCRSVSILMIQTESADEIKRLGELKAVVALKAELYNDLLQRIHSTSNQLSSDVYQSGLFPLSIRSKKRSKIKKRDG